MRASGRNVTHALAAMQLTTPHFDDDELELLRACLNSGWVTQGPMTQQFERLIAERHGVKHAMATTSCTAALHLATMALELAPETRLWCRRSLG